MKIAIVYTGIPRLIERSSSYFKDRMIGGNDIDIFSYVWQCEEYKELDLHYEHKVLQYQKPIDFFSKYTRTSVNVYSHWYGLQMASKSFQSYVDTNKIKYDLIVRTRHDIALYNKIDFHSLDNNLLHVADCHWPNHHLFDDNLMILNQENYFNIFGNIYDWYEERNGSHDYFDIPEQKLQDYLLHKNMLHKVVRNQNLDFVLTRGIR